ncbi:MAG TPA: secondary thiamine-phosphate synthase enzyme YjbQ [Nitrospinota bacterium]|nr:secondary thiamine-phosphate synthase enzyme YjbQ [Nitrospinota bacterium]
MIFEFSVNSKKKTQLIDITPDVGRAVSESGLSDGLVTVYTPHTTAGVTINENADPSVQVDLAYAMDKLVPWNDKSYSHLEGNSAAHIKSSLVGCSESLIVKNGILLLGTWQGIFFCEFDGPRARLFYVKAI